MEFFSRSIMRFSSVILIKSIIIVGFFTHIIMLFYFNDLNNELDLHFHQS